MHPAILLSLLQALMGGAAQANAPASQPSSDAVAALVAALAQQKASEPVSVPQQKGSTVIEVVVIIAFLAAMVAIAVLSLLAGQPLLAAFALAFGMGVLASKFGTVVDFRFGSSWGSRMKEARVPATPIVIGSPPVTVPQEPGPDQPAVPAAQKHTGVTATVFGGSSDPNVSAYDGHQITDSELGVALPARFKGARPKVRIWKGDKDVVATIVDVGPWNTDDPYWETGARPQAESGTDKSGRKTNKAGIDLTPAAARALGIDGKGVVDWSFVNAETGIPGSKRPTGADIVALAKKHIGEKYVNVQVPKDRADWTGPWDCAEFASWLVYQTAGILYGCTDDKATPAKADAYTGAWKADANSKGRMVSVSEAAGTPGAFLLRYPPAPGEMGHIAVSDGQGGTIEAASSSTGVVAGKVSGRRWDTGVMPPGIDYSGGNVAVRGPAKIYAVGQPNMDPTIIKAIQTALAAKGFSPGEIDGEFGTNTALAVAAFQRAQGIIADGEIGEVTAPLLGVTL